MESIHRTILENMRRKIVDDLDVRNRVTDALIKANVLKSDQVERIMLLSSREQRVQLLLDILPGCGRTAFNTFRESLRHHYWWLADGIDESLKSRSQDTPDFIRSVPERPNLPYQPPPIFREKKVAEMKTALENLEPGGYLVLHGMEGFGKSSLTASVLADEELVLRLFNNKVYWIKFGCKRSIEDEISIQLNRLYHQVVESSDNINSSFSNLESLKQHLLNCLETHFHKNNLRNSLLILDDVSKNDIIEAFDFPCKTLVITSDLHILEDKTLTIIQLKNGFTESESLRLFAESLNIEVKTLPSAAKRIHEECYGSPMLISMLAAEFKKFEDMVYNTERWMSYLNALRNNDPTSCRMLGTVQARQNAIFHMCIEKLDDDAKSRYEKLVIFSEDVNITPQTLQILWGDQSQFQADQHMLYFCEKSLAVRHHNRLLKSYIYGVHDLLLCYMRGKIRSDQLCNLHRSFIKKYCEYCRGDYSKLPDDNYSFSYIGHHLEQSEMFEEFKRMYLNFDFLREKINHSGLSDLLIDLKKYRRLITGDDEEVEAKVVDLEEFLKKEAGTIVNHKRRKCLDLVQIGLIYSKSGFVAQNVRQIAEEQSSKLYVTYDKKYGSYEVLESLEVRQDTREAVFLNHPNKILIGNSIGEVMLYNCETHEYSLFSDNRDTETNSTNTGIRKIIVSSNGDFFLTLRVSGQVNLFNVRSEDQQSSGLSSRRGQTPREKQSFWIPVHGDNIRKDSSHLPIFIANETITDMALSNDNRIGICTSSGTIEVWTIDGEKIFSERVMKQKDKGVFENFQWVAFAEKTAILQVMNCDGNISFYSEQKDVLTTSHRYRIIFAYNPAFKEHNFILFQPRPATTKCLVVVTEKRPYYLTWHELTDGNDLSRIQGIFSPALREGTKINNVTSFFTCAALTDDGKYLITGYAKGVVTVWNVDEMSDPIITFSGNVTSLDTFWLSEGRHLISGSEDRVIHRWCLENLPVRSLLFDAVMKPWGEDDIVAKESFDNTIEVFHGNLMIVKTEKFEGTLTHLIINSEGNKMVYANRVEISENSPLWIVSVFDMESKETTPIFSLRARPTMLKFLNIDGNAGIVYTAQEDLGIWYGIESPRSSASGGNVINMHIVDDSRVLTIAPDALRLFQVTNMDWRLNRLVDNPCTTDDNMVYSSMAPNSTSLTILTAMGLMIMYEIENDNSVIPAEIKLWRQESSIPTFDQKIICCKYSEDSKYLAVGLDNGGVSVIDVLTRVKVYELDFHCHEVNSLHWLPSSIGPPILLSADRNEVAWWIINAGLNEKQKNQHNRKHPFRSALNTLSESNGTSQSSSGLDSHNSGNQDINNNAVIFWKTKTARYYNRHDLLSVVPLPSTLKLKLCVSSDFTKLLFIDVHGSVYNLKFINYT